QSMFSSGYDGPGLNDDWSWTYKTCNETWVNNVDTSDTRSTPEHPNDITGTPACPTPSPTGGTMPPTGNNVTGLVLIGSGVVLGGVVLLLAAGRRPRRRTA